MPGPVSRKQARYMAAILYSKNKGTSSRGDRVPDAVAKKYIGSKKKADDAKDNSDDGLPESKGKEHAGGKWTSEHHKKHKEKSLKKADVVHTRKGAGCLVINQRGQILLGKRADTGEWACPGGSVDEGEDFKTAALRELKEEASLLGTDPEFLIEHDFHGVQSQTFVVKLYQGTPAGNGELQALQWFEPQQLPFDSMTKYTKAAIKKYAAKHPGDLRWMVAEEDLKKNIIRSGGAPNDVVYQVTHGDALKLVGTSTFRFLKDAVSSMSDEDIKDIPLDTYTLHVRKHVNDVYSGRILDGHKQIHQFTNKSLPAVAAELMSVFEWYLPEDEKVLDQLQDSGISDDEIEGGLSHLVSDYQKNNLANIYEEMEHIRQEIRNGAAVDLQQIEAKIMKLFDKLEQAATLTAKKHNELASDVGKAIDEVEMKLARLQDMLEGMHKKPSKIEAFSTEPQNPTAIHSDFYPYLSRPKVDISPTGHITISFGMDWAPMDQSNFLHDMKARALKKSDPKKKKK